MDLPCTVALSDGFGSERVGGSLKNGQKALRFCCVGMKNMHERCGGEFWKAFLHT